MPDNIQEEEQCKTGVLVRLRRMRGMLHDFKDLNEKGGLTHWQCIMMVNGFCAEMDVLLDEAQYILQEFTEDKGEAHQAINCLLTQFNELEEEAIELRKRLSNE